LSLPSKVKVAVVSVVGLAGLVKITVSGASLSSTMIVHS
jgi:hypothetical protein